MFQQYPQSDVNEPIPLHEGRCSRLGGRSLRRRKRLGPFAMAAISGHRV